MLLLMLTLYPIASFKKCKHKAHRSIGWVDRSVQNDFMTFFTIWYVVQDDLIPYQTDPCKFIPYQTDPCKFIPYQTDPCKFIPYQTDPCKFILTKRIHVSLFLTKQIRVSLFLTKQIHVSLFLTKPIHVSLFIWDLVVLLLNTTLPNRSI